MSDRPRRDNTAPVGSIDLPAFNDSVQPYPIRACHDCLPWHAEVVRDPETAEIMVREWHAVECPHFLTLLSD